MTREDTHRKIEQEAKSDSSMHENYIHVLVAKMIVNEIFNEHEVQLKALYFQITELKMMEEDAQQYALRCSKELKAKDEEIERLKENITPYCVDSYFIGYSRAHTKARSIVAMLFWMMKRQKAIYAKRHKELGQHHEQVAYYKGAYDNSKTRFKQAYRMVIG